MELQDEIRIKAPREAVYAALNDPEVLRHCIPGCEELIPRSKKLMNVKIALRVGPMKARFGGKVKLDKRGAPETFAMFGPGGRTDIELVEDGAETLLRYNAKVDLKGTLAQLGSGLITMTAKKLSATFFDRFKGVVEQNTGSAQS